MYYSFDTKDENAAIAALLVYGIYRSRDRKRFKITPDMWGIIERGARSSAKRALDLHDFIEKMKPKLSCSSLQPRWMDTDTHTLTMVQDLTDGSFVHIEDQGRKKFWVEILEEIDHRLVLDVLYKKTAWVIALVRDRLERERPFEVKGILKEDEPDAQVL